MSRTKTIAKVMSHSPDVIHKDLVKRLATELLVRASSFKTADMGYSAVEDYALGVSQLAITGIPCFVTKDASGPIRRITVKAGDREGPLTEKEAQKALQGLQTLSCGIYQDEGPATTGTRETGFGGEDAAVAGPAAV